jgi:hypothetical protein
MINSLDFYALMIVLLYFDIPQHRATYPTFMTNSPNFYVFMFVLLYFDILQYR